MLLLEQNVHFWPINTSGEKATQHTEYMILLLKKGSSSIILWICLSSSGREKLEKPCGKTFSSKFGKRFYNGTPLGFSFANIFYIFFFVLNLKSSEKYLTICPGLLRQFYTLLKVLCFLKHE